MSSESSSSLREKKVHSRPRRKAAVMSATRALKQSALKRQAVNDDSEEDESDECTESDFGCSSTSEESSDVDNSSVIYMDYNATTPLDRDVLSAIHQALKSAWGNPSSSHQAGIEAKLVIKEARHSVAAMVGAMPEDIIFTSGGTEANNMVLHTVVDHFSGAWSTEMTTCNPPKPHIVSTSLEHDSIKFVLEKYEQQGKAEVTFVDAVKGSGCVSPDDIIAAMKPNTCLVTVMLANNETGIIQPLSKISAKVRQFCSETGHRPILVHSDAAQAIGKIPVDVEKLGVDYLTIVGHKFYAPRIGALYVRQPGLKTPLSAMFFGGGQERNFRPGTENTGMIAGLGKACELVRRNVDRYQRHMSTVRDILEKQIQAAFPSGVHFNGKQDGIERLPNTCNVSIIGKNLHGYRILSRASRLQASLGAACHSEQSHHASSVLLASGIPEEVAMNAIRISVGRHTTLQDVDGAVAELKSSVSMLLSETADDIASNLL